MRTREDVASEPLVYVAPPAGAAPERALVALGGPAAGRRFVFHDHLEIGRLQPEVATPPGSLRVADATVSARHCVITQDQDGHCFVRDISRNGTRLDNHRLVPGAEVEMKSGQVLSVARGIEFGLEALTVERPAGPDGGERFTLGVPTETVVTVLVGDIRRFTTLVREAPAEALQRSVDALFQELEKRVTGLDGTLKEYPGDAILAYWEAGDLETCAERACRAALALAGAARELAADRGVWRLADRPLQMDWALATGEVLIGSRGGAHPVGLSMVGAPVVLAYRLEKLAGDHSGPILACGRTRELAGHSFCFRMLGMKAVEGFAAPQAVFALDSPR